MYITLVMEDIGRHINFNKFLEERSVQIARFLNQLEMDTKKTGHQALPKSVRRRAMSHNRFRIPRRLRKNMDDDLAKNQRMQKLPKCRKHIRKRRHLIAAYKLRDTSKRWLSTHLWAAKRMRMINYYGFRIAFTPNNKSFRSAYRHSQHGCTLADISYYMSISLTSKTLQQLPCSIKLKQSGLPECGTLCEGQILDDNKLVCPGLLLRCKSSSNDFTVRFFFHPAALEDVKRIKVPQGWSASLEQGQTDLYLLNGPQSLQILEQGLRQYGMIPKQQRISNLFYQQKSFALYLNTENNYSLTNKPAISIPILQQKLLTKGYNSDSNKSLRTRMISIFKDLSSNKSQSYCSSQKAFWDIYNRGQNNDLQATKFKITLRSKYTHRRTNKMTKQQKKIVIRAQKQSSSQAPRKRKNKQESEASQSSFVQKKIFVEDAQKKDAVFQPVEPILIGKNKDFYYVWATNCGNCRFWRILTKLNVKVIGRRQLAHVHLQKSKRLFPQDYPQTNAFMVHRSEYININFQKYLKIPFQKRPNYLKLLSPSPFSSILPQKPLPVQLQMVSRGCCERYSYICQLLNEDLPKISNGLEQGHIGIVHSQQVEGQRVKYRQWNEMEADLTVLKPFRKIIGSVTSGGYLYSRSKEGGIGFINQSLITPNYFDKFGDYVLVRRVNSPHYMLAQLTKRKQFSE